jgi:hypothetical protein
MAVLIARDGLDEHALLLGYVKVGTTHVEQHFVVLLVPSGSMQFGPIVPANGTGADDCDCCPPHAICHDYVTLTI